MPWADDYYHTTQWKRTAKRILRRDKNICYICHQPGATQCDHIIPRARGGSDDDNNLAAIHGTPCHRDKTLREAAQGQALKSRKRQPRTHPGMT